MGSAHRSIAGGIVVALAVFARPAAAAYNESHLTGDDVRVSVDGAGRATIEHALTYRVASGALKTIDLNGLEPEAVAAPEAAITVDQAGEHGRAFVGGVERRGERALRVTVQEPKGLAKGTYVVRVRYAVDLVQTRALAPDGALWRLTWTGPIAPEGYDAARVTFDLPAAPTEPRAASTDGVPEDAHLATLKRGAERDELEILRPRVARGEAPVWSVRVDPKAFPDVRDPTLRPAPPPPAPAPSRWKEIVAAGAWLVVAAAFGALVRRKTRVVDAAHAAHRLAPRPLVRLPAWARPVLAGAIFASGAACEAFASPTLGAALVVVAMALVAWRAPNAPLPVRGPGQWLALTPAEAYAPDRRGDALDLFTARGKLVALASAALVAALAFALRRLDAEAPWIVALDALVLVPIFVTGSARQLPPDAARAPAPTLAAIHRALKGDAALKVAPWARVPQGGDRADELRLLVVPRASIPGLAGIEIGVAWRRTTTGYAPESEVLVRVHDATAAAAKLTALAPRARAVPGRRAEERVIRLAPASPSRAAVLRLVRRLARELVDRRVTVAAAAPARGPKWRGVERRLPPNERIADARARASAASLPAAAA